MIRPKSKLKVDNLKSFKILIEKNSTFILNFSRVYKFLDQTGWTKIHSKFVVLCILYTNT